ncbi:VWA domain-containing protein [uncultured Salegentibacter sp.]|uniref:VWA domain-containing protein n=1 Tax=uncultured Salegentibacter sp. TaxID=259320 RepID=UPI002591EA95|nr:VWA domain-containing protein [uncultured Salegentibacter sp.]
MELSKILFIALAAFIALGFAFFQYLYKSRKRGRDTYILFSLRFFSVFILLLLLINPKIGFTSYKLEKPMLILLADDSWSINHLKQEDSLKLILESFKSNEKLSKRFDLVQYNFGKELKSGDINDFKDTETNIFSALEGVEALSKERKSVIALISDGNQTSGRNFEYFNSKNTEIYPFVIGDTTQYPDLELTRLNLNNYAFLDNRFPVEAFISYSGEDAVNTRFVIKENEKVIFSEEVSLDNDNNSVIIQAELPATNLGVLSYKAEIAPLATEKNQANNIKSFAIEVIDERTEILLLSAMPHPDLGAIKKAVETNKQRQLAIKYIGENDLNLEDYQLVILYQPNAGFLSVFEELKKNNQNYLLITGTKTNWNFINNIQDFIKKDFTNQNQEIFAVRNPNFNQFQFEDAVFSNFPPLEDKFGNIELESNSIESIYFQEIENVETTQPLLAIQGNAQRKIGYIFGENIWRWRSASFLEDKSFEAFDNFFGKLVQNLASTKQRERLTLDYESFFYENESAIINANFFDQNYQFDPKANLLITVEDSLNSFESQFILKNNTYQVDLGGLPPGTYTFQVNEAETGLSRSGSFEVISYNIEQKFISANKNAMQALAENSGTRIFYQNQTQEFINRLLNADKYKPVQKSQQKDVPLIDWFYLLFLLVLILAIEWFYRKYKGLI